MRTAFRTQILLLFSWTLSCGAALLAAEVPGGEELKKLLPHLQATCAVVRENPAMWPYRSFPYGPLGLEVRKASPQEADKIRNFHLGMAAAACKVPASQVTAAFFCGPDCPKNRRDHLVGQLASVRTAVASFDHLKGVRLISIWAPAEELRINDVFVMSEGVREAIPSAKFGLVPSGDWKLWTSLAAYLVTIGASDTAVSNIVSQMRAVGISALVRETSATRAVGVGIGDNESGLLFLPSGTAVPKVGDTRPDGNKYQIVEKVGADIFYYETS